MLDVLERIKNEATEGIELTTVGFGMGNYNDRLMEQLANARQEAPFDRAGTGEFFLQQLRRMDVTLEEAARWAVEEEPYHVSGRCSVFCKSDCTHATNKGIPKSKVTAGLCRMMADKIMELLKRVEHRNIMVIGGTTRNRMMVKYLNQKIPGLVIPEEAPFFEALGAALWALENKTIKTTNSDQKPLEGPVFIDKLLYSCHISRWLKAG